MKKVNNIVISLFIGVIVGAGVVLFSLTSLTQLGLFPTNIEKEESSSVLAATVPSDPNDIINSIEKVSDAVVGVVNVQSANPMSQGDAGTGSGVIYKKENGFTFIVTNHHVVAGANSVEVTLSNGKRVPAEILGSDQLTDLAVLKMEDQEETTVAELGNSDKLRIGETVLAIGNPLGAEFSGSVTQGIVSGLERYIPVDLNKDGRDDWQTEVIQTDTAINPGNSGGALINRRGQLIGINSMKITQQAVEGIGFAIPISLAKPIIDDLEISGEVHRPFVGIGAISLTEVPVSELQQTMKLPPNVTKGIVIANVSPDSPAVRADLRKMDVIVEMDGTPITNLVDFRKFLYEKKEIGDTVEVTFYRSGEIQKVILTLSEEAPN